MALATRLQGGTLDGEEALRLALDLCATLAVIHDCGLAHRDLKPANILMTELGQARLIDFGLATRSHLSTGAAVTGTFRYSAPEQTGMLDRPLDGRADLYALGVVLFECLAGRPPFVADEPAEADPSARRGYIAGPGQVGAPNAAITGGSGPALDGQGPR